MLLTSTVVVSPQIERSYEQIRELKATLLGRDDELKAAKTRASKQVADLAAEVESLKKTINELSVENTRLQATVQATTAYKVSNKRWCPASFSPVELLGFGIVAGGGIALLRDGLWLVWWLGRCSTRQRRHKSI